LKKTISTEQTTANIQKVMELLASVPDRLERLGSTLSEEQIRRPMGPGERSYFEVLVHLLNSETRSLEITYLAIFAEEPLLVGIHTERQLAGLLRYDLLPLSDLLVYFRLRRKILLQVLGSLSGEQWDRRIREQGKQRRESIYWRARGLALHELEHLTDLEAKLVSPD
jgi:hypothetical protein